MNAAADRFFVDTNVLLYSVDDSDVTKHDRARKWLDSLWAANSGRLSWQVLNEFYANAIRKLKKPAVRVRQNVDAFAMWQPVGFGLGMLHRAWHWNDTRGLPYWDSLIVASAESTGCKYLLSEDFQAGQEFSGVTVVNPFLSSPDEFNLA